MLRNLKVAAILKCKSIEEEAKTRKQMKLATQIYLPLYAFLTISNYVMEIALFQNASIKISYICFALYTVSNLTKLVCETFIGITTLNFVNQIKQLIQLMSYEFGEKFPQIKRLQLMRKLLIWLSVTYLLLDLLINLVLPTGYVILTLVINDAGEVQYEAYWEESLQLVSDIRVQFMLAFNVQMVYFYYKLALPMKAGHSVEFIEQMMTERSNAPSSQKLTMES